MYQTRGIEAVATVTELRSRTAHLLEHARMLKHGILIQKNNEPYAVLVGFDRYVGLVGHNGRPNAERL